MNAVLECFISMTYARYFLCVFFLSREIIQKFLEVSDGVLYISFHTICHTVSKFANFIPIYPTTSFLLLLFSGVQRNNSAHPIINARSEKATLLSHRFSIPLRLFYSPSVLFFSKQIPSQEFHFSS